MASPNFTINGSTCPPEKAVAYGATVTLELLSTSGVNTVTWAIAGTDNPATPIPAIAPAGSPLGATATFAMVADPTTGLGVSFRLRCVVNGGRDSAGQFDPSLTKTAVVGVLNQTAVVPFSVGEKLERDPNYGWTTPLNRALAGPATVAHGDIQPADGIHGIIRRSFSTSTARTTATYTALDKGGVFEQTDTDPPSLWYAYKVVSGVASWLQFTMSGGIVSPLVTMAGHIKAMHEATTGLTTSAWTSQSPSGSAMNAGGGILVGSDSGGAYAQATGSHYLTNGWTPPSFGTSPVVIDAIVQQDTFSAGGLMVGCGVGGACSVREHTSTTGQMSISNTTALSAAFALGSFKRVRAIFTGATSGTADSVQVGGASPVTGFAGNTSPASPLSIGAAVGAFFIGKWRAVYAYDLIDAAKFLANDAYYESKWPGVTT